MVKSINFQMEEEEMESLLEKKGNRTWEEVMDELSNLPIEAFREVKK